MRSAPSLVPLIAGLAATIALPTSARAQITINELRIDNPGADDSEFFELAGPASGSLDGLTYIVIGDGPNGDFGVVECVVDLNGLTLKANGFLSISPHGIGCNDPVFGLGYDVTASSTTFRFENNDNVSHLLVSGFTGALYDDLDTNDDGVLDATPWSSIVDCVAILFRPAGEGDPTYCFPLIGPDPRPSPDGPLTYHAPAHLYRCSGQWHYEALYDDARTGSPVYCRDTPGADNIQCGFTPPQVDELRIETCPPAPFNPVTVSAKASDLDGDLASVFLYYRTHPDSVYVPILMTENSDDYSAQIPITVDPTVEYYVEAMDLLGFTARAPARGLTDPARYATLPVPIASAQQDTTVAGDCSPLLRDSPVLVQGVVTHVPGEFSPKYVYIQDVIPQPQGGIKVYSPEGGLESLAPGDLVDVSGIVKEYRCQTQVTTTPGCIQVVGSGPVIPYSLGSLDQVAMEDYESMLVTITGPIAIDSIRTFNVTKGNDTYLMTEIDISKGGQTTIVGDDTFFPDGIGWSVTIAEGDTLDSITGIVGARYGQTLRLEPRRDPDVALDLAVGVNDGPPTEIDAFRLDPGRPNPARARTTIGFSVPDGGTATIQVYDVSGRRVRTLMDRRVPAGAQGVVSWDGTDDAGRAVAPGVYFYRLQAGEKAASRKIHLIR